MHGVDLLEEAIGLAQSLGYRIRQEWVGSGGGVCEVRGQRWLFIDLSQNVWEQLETVRAALEKEPGLGRLKVTPQLGRLLAARKAA